MSMNMDSAYKGILRESVSGANNGKLMKTFKFKGNVGAEVHLYKNVAGERRLIFDFDEGAKKDKPLFTKLFKFCFVAMKTLGVSDIIVVPYNSAMSAAERKFARGLLLEFVEAKNLQWKKVPNYPYQIVITNSKVVKGKNQYKMGSQEKI